MQNFIRIALTALIMSLMFCGSAFAQESVRQFSQESGKLAVKAKEYQAKSNHNQAVKTLRKALKIDGLTAYETSAMNQMLGGSYFALEKNKKAIQSFEHAIEAGGLGESEIREMKSNIAQLNILRKKFSLGAQQLEAYFYEGGEQKENLVRLLMQAHIQAKNDSAAAAWSMVMLDRNLLKTRKDYDAALYLFDSPLHRTRQVEVANKMLKRWPRDASLQLTIAVLRGKAEREGVDPIVLAGKSEMVEKAKRADYSGVSFQEAKPIVRFPGRMPPGATKSGHCKIIFDITPEGSVANARTKSCTDPIFEPPSLQSIKRGIYSPKIVNGEPVVMPNVEQTVRYIMHNSKGEKLPE